MQCYITAPKSKVRRPIKQLIGFQRVALAAGESRTVTFTLPYNDRAFWFWDERKRKFVIELGKLEVMIGSSSAHIHLSTFVHLEPCTDSSLGAPESLQTVMVAPAVI